MLRQFRFNELPRIKKDTAMEGSRTGCVECFYGSRTHVWFMVLFQEDIDTKEICKRFGNLEILLAIFVFANLQKKSNRDNVTW